MSKENRNPAEIKKKYKEIVYDEVKYGIITAIIWYDSLNLKDLARLVGRPETTTIRYVKQLLEDGLIDVDAEKTATSWGKFYKLSTVVRELYDKQLKKIEQRSETILKEYETVKDKGEEEIYKFFEKHVISKDNLEIDILSAKQSVAFSHNIQNMIINEITYAVDNLNKILQEKGRKHVENNLVIDPTDVEIHNLSLSLSSTKQLFRLIETYSKFQEELVKLKKEFKQEMDQDGVPEEKRKIFYNYLFMGSLDFSYRFQDEE
ncbi:MAG: winged helix-turn-helix domain-containing protein [Asgard group archaeon]|nr:winged helix-turn-helix domain-containing protein [Asgard group archaeon]